MLPKDDRVIFTKKIPRVEAEKISSEANIILIPSRREGCPMALLEAMRYGVISITSNYDNACKELIVNGYNGFIRSRKNVDEFVEVLKEILANPTNYDHLYDNSLETYRSKLSYYSWKNKMDDLIYQAPIMHKQRIASFKKSYYLFSVLKFKLLNLSNYIDKSINETLASAIPFFFFYLTNKCSRWKN